MILLILSFGTTFIGAITGFGGGFIMKPLLDVMGVYSASTISVLSSVTVLAMSMVSTIRYRSAHRCYTKRTLLLSIGAAAGGYIGGQLFLLCKRWCEDNTLKLLQAAILICLLFAMFFQKRYPRFQIDNSWLPPIVGLALGVLSSFLGIGGGPFNVVVFSVLFSCTMKEATVHSLFTILCSQAVAVLNKIIQAEITFDHLLLLAFMVPAAIAGALLGPFINRKMSEKNIEHLYVVTTGLMLLINVGVLIQCILSDL